MVRKIIDLKKGSAWKCVHLLRIQITHFKRNGGAISDKQIVFPQTLVCGVSVLVG